MLLYFYFSLKNYQTSREHIDQMFLLFFSSTQPRLNYISVYIWHESIEECENEIFWEILQKSSVF